MTENTWPIYIHLVNVVGFIIILVGFLNGGSFRVMIFGLVFMGFGALYSGYAILRFIREKRNKP